MPKRKLKERLFEKGRKPKPPTPAPLVDAEEDLGETDPILVEETTADEPTSIPPVLKDDDADDDSEASGSEDDAEPAQYIAQDDSEGNTAIAADETEEPAEGDDDDDMEENVELEKEAPFVSDGVYRNKQRVLIFSSRGITSRYRHLMDDLRKLTPHHKKDVKLDTGSKESLSDAINSICEMKSCNGCLFLECRKKQDLYLWASKAPDGPSAKFHVQNVHTMDELKMTGNCMQGSRPLLNFDEKFDQLPQWRLVKALFIDLFGTPRGHPKSKPFIDRVMSFFVADGRVWVRNYQIVDQSPGGSLEKRLEKKGEETTTLVEIGPRFVLNPIKIFAGSFGGATLYSNPAYVSPNEVRASKRRKFGTKFAERTAAKQDTRHRKEAAVMPVNPFAGVFKP